MNSWQQSIDSQSLRPHTTSRWQPGSARGTYLTASQAKRPACAGTALSRDIGRSRVYCTICHLQRRSTASIPVLPTLTPRTYPCIETIRTKRCYQSLTRRGKHCKAIRVEIRRGLLDVGRYIIRRQIKNRQSITFAGRPTPRAELSCAEVGIPQ